MNRLFLLLFISAALFGMMALMPEGKREQKSMLLVQDFSQERDPSSLPRFHHSVPASGEPSDDGLTQNLHREFRDALNRDPLSAIELAKEFIFTRELDPSFRLEILREIKAIQFSQPGVSELADEILRAKPDPQLFEEALSIKYATMSEEEFSSYIAELAQVTEEPEYSTLIEKHVGPEPAFILSSPLSHTVEEPLNTAPVPQATTVSG